MNPELVQFLAVIGAATTIYLFVWWVGLVIGTFRDWQHSRWVKRTTAAVHAEFAAIAEARKP